MNAHSSRTLSLIAFAYSSQLLGYVCEQDGRGTSIQNVHEWCRASGMDARHHGMMQKLAEAVP